MTEKKVDVIVIGAGPAGIFAALELSKLAPELSLLIVEKGPDIAHRSCPMLEKKGQQCAHCSPCLVLCGWGGAGAFSDGKLTLTTEFGGFLPEYMEKSELDSLISYVDSQYIRFGAPDQVYGTDRGRVRELTRAAARAGLRLLPGKIRHLGTENCPAILSRMRDSISNNVEILHRTTVKTITSEDGHVSGVELLDGTRIYSRYVIAAPGREGAEWFRGEAARLGLKLANNPVDIGVRVEVPAVITEDIAKDVYEPKLIYYSKSFDDPVRTFCFNPNGEVVMENNGGLITVNGHSYVDKRTENSNFALLVSKTFTEPFREPIAYGKYIASLANMLGGGILVQRLGDLMAGRRSTERRLAKAMVEPTLREATPGDLSLVLPYRHLIDILEMLEALDLIIPGVNSKHTLLYGVEVKFYSSRPEVHRDFETHTRNLYAIGDGAGVTRSLAQASVSGVVAARSIAQKESR